VRTVTHERQIEVERLQHRCETPADWSCCPPPPEDAAVRCGRSGRRQRHRRVQVIFETMQASSRSVVRSRHHERDRPGAACSASAQRQTRERATQASRASTFQSRARPPRGRRTGLSAMSGVGPSAPAASALHGCVAPRCVRPRQQTPARVRKDRADQPDVALTLRVGTRVSSWTGRRGRNVTDATNVEPVPSSDCTETSPPIIRTSRLVIARPSPFRHSFGSCFPRPG
jgi:hypothetical protein